jgi:murein DD-endopeptidase MepM/ murein hydrolase activator NlpD
MSKTNATVGQEVKPGDVVGYVGTTGASTGNHLHFQINVHDIPVNPRTFMAGELGG